MGEKPRIEFQKDVKRDEGNKRITARFIVDGDEDEVFEIQYKDTNAQPVPKEVRNFGDDITVEDAHFNKVMPVENMLGTSKNTFQLHYGNVFQENDDITIRKEEGDQRVVESEVAASADFWYRMPVIGSIVSSWILKWRVKRIYKKILGNLPTGDSGGINHPFYRPKLVVTKKNEFQYAYYGISERTIYVDELTVEFAELNDDAIAIAIGHELAESLASHYIQADLMDHNYFDSPRKEDSCDLLGIVYASLAGYNGIKGYRSIIELETNLWAKLGTKKRHPLNNRIATPENLEGKLSILDLETLRSSRLPVNMEIAATVIAYTELFADDTVFAEAHNGCLTKYMPDTLRQIHWLSELFKQFFVPGYRETEVLNRAGQIFREISQSASLNAKSVEGADSTFALSRQDKKHLSQEIADDSNLLREAAKYLKTCPINEYVDLTPIPRIEGQIKQNMETLARSIALNNSLGFNIRYILEGDTGDENFKKELEAALRNLRYINADGIIKYINKPHTGANVIEVKLQDITSIYDNQKIQNREYIIALKNYENIPGISIPNYTAASSMGLALAALRIAKDKADRSKSPEDIRDYEELRDDALDLFRSIYKRYEIIENEDDFIVDELELMVTGSSATKLYFTLLYALPPIVKGTLDLINEYHREIHLQQHA